MKTANAALLAILNTTGSTFVYADLYKFELRNGTNVYWTDWGFNVIKDGITYLSTESIIEGTRYKLQRGLDVSECEFKIIPLAGTTINGVSVPKAFENGLFDRAIVTKYRLFLNDAEKLDIPVNEPAANALLLFLGEITDAAPFGNEISVRAKSLTNLLNIMMPRRQYQPKCGFTFGDSNCTKSRAALAVSGTVSISSTTSSIITDLTQSAGYFNNGTVEITSGNNTGAIRSIKNYGAGTITLVAPFPSALNVGDTFTATPGCNKNYAGGTTTVYGAAASGTTVSKIVTTLKQSDGYFNGATLTFTTGENAGQSRIVSSWAGSVATLSSGFPKTPAVSDSFYLVAVSSNSGGSCTGYSNTSHFGGFPFIPVPETSF